MVRRVLVPMYRFLASMAGEIGVSEFGSEQHTKRVALVTEVEI